MPLPDYCWEILQLASVTSISGRSWYGYDRWRNEKKCSKKVHMHTIKNKREFWFSFALALIFQIYIYFFSLFLELVCCCCCNVKEADTI